MNLARALGPVLLLGGLTLAAQAPPGPGPRDRCPVCGMFVAKYPEWVAAVRLPDGSWRYFDGLKDGFTFLQATPDAARSAVFAKDYYSLAWIDARQAWFVVGSSVLGPMGAELVPFGAEAGARSFRRDHGGQRILRFAEVGPDVLKALK